ncbi:hypothetical protein [Piscirickettsia salmonis]|uniref:hypothetical protein n=1 Tax=Piscirickettsia salmonis TaxID=1238 RepID=UPI000ACCF424|nr:hypothetical protein [Piscirickettsia salmonis]QGN79946.1 hypothetical protein Psal002_00562 [Piscirickettsia salmonis]QGN90548.1 hypothetical protein Psal005_00556 [Piscirickettsia salmonis]QGO15375.1 hypothetical protein Psal011_00556 [Piscirickettsia salmonis]QGO18371.1 hypothetical protein Psal011_03634 [Piscirickettsia salmonis]QGO22437.1 hypothetical protein Psal025_00559 [Piscirickettsia salmonis]
MVEDTTSNLQTSSTQEKYSMRSIMALRDDYQNHLREHHFFKWLHSQNVSLEKKFDFIPAMAVFVMNFRDMNLWVIRFNEGNDQFKAVINSSTIEDETHSRLFLEDWRKFNLDDKLKWKASDVLWWLFLSEDMEPFRKYGVEFMKLSTEDNNDPLVRFAHSEAGEACGHVFFENISPMADNLGKKNNLEYRYFGSFHLDLETGHVLESEDIFQDQQITPEQYNKSIKLAKHMFSIFDGIHDNFLNYAKKYVETGGLPHKKMAIDYVDNQNKSTNIGYIPSKKFQIHSSQKDLESHLKYRMKNAENHSFYEWMKNDNLPALKKLQRFIPLWAVDIFGYRDLNKYVFRYNKPKTDLEYSVNTIASNLEKHSQLFLQDWVELKLDEVLRWSGSSTLEFLFLDYFMDMHRKNLINFAMLGLKNTNAFERLWFMEALESSGHAFFSNTRQLALQAEEEHHIRLDYLSNRHSIVHARKQNKTIDFKNIPLNDANTVKSINNIIDIVFDALEENLDLSLQASTLNKFSIR